MKEAFTNAKLSLTALTARGLRICRIVEGIKVQMLSALLWSRFSFSTLDSLNVSRHRPRYVYVKSILNSLCGIRYSDQLEHVERRPSLLFGPTRLAFKSQKVEAIDLWLASLLRPVPELVLIGAADTSEAHRLARDCREAFPRCGLIFEGMSLASAASEYNTLVDDGRLVAGCFLPSVLLSKSES